jgi:hypothetical protein
MGPLAVALRGTLNRQTSSTANCLMLGREVNISAPVMFNPHNQKPMKKVGKVVQMWIGMFWT